MKYRITLGFSHLFPDDGDRISQLSCLPVDLDAVVEKLLERSGVEDAILHRDEAVDDKLHRLLLGALLRLGLQRKNIVHQSQQLN